jgi:outer membrane protein assembly factor BamB
MRFDWQVWTRRFCILALAGGGSGCFASETPKATPNFTLTVNVNNLSLTAGGGVKAVTISAAAQNGFSGIIEVKASGLPADVTASPLTFSLKPGTARQLTFQASSKEPAISETAVFTATSGALKHLAALVLHVSLPLDAVTHHYNIERTGLNSAETVLTYANVTKSKFGLLRILPVDGVVDAEPLFLSNIEIGGKVRNVVYVASEHDSVFAFDADTGTRLWTHSVLGVHETTTGDFGCGQISPEIGITSTPVIDRKAGPHGTIFVVGMSQDQTGNYHQRLHALDITTGVELKHSPTEVQATYPGTGDNSSNGRVVFDPAQYAERSGLLLLNGAIYLGWTSHCDSGPYTGWLMGYSESTLAQTSVLNLTPNGSEGSIWMAGSGLAAGPEGYIFFLDANGTFDPKLDTKGFPVNGDYGNGFIKVSTSGGKLAVSDYFEMSNTVNESNMDEDLGSGGAILLPDMKDAKGRTQLLALGAGKDGNIYVVNRANMGKFNPKNDNAIYQEVDGEISGVWSKPAYFNDTVYYAAAGDRLKAFPIASAKLATAPSRQSTISFGYPGATPTISANGTNDGIVWAVESAQGSPAVLHAYEAGNLQELYNSNEAAKGRDSFGDGNKFITPLEIDGKVFIGTPNGVAEFGLLP